MPGAAAISWDTLRSSESNSVKSRWQGAITSPEYPHSLGPGSSTVPPQGDLESTYKTPMSSRRQVLPKQQVPSEHPARKKDIQGICESTWVFLVRDDLPHVWQLGKAHEGLAPQDAMG